MHYIINATRPRVIPVYGLLFLALAVYLHELLIENWLLIFQLQTLSWTSLLRTTFAVATTFGVLASGTILLTAWIKKEDLKLFSKLGVTGCLTCGLGMAAWLTLTFSAIASAYSLPIWPAAIVSIALSFSFSAYTGVAAEFEQEREVRDPSLTGLFYT